MTTPKADAVSTRLFLKSNRKKTYIKNNIVLDEELEEDDYFVDEDKDEEYFDEGVGTSRYDVFTDSPDWESRVHPVTGKKLWLFVMHKVRQNDRIVDAVNSSLILSGISVWL
jgi:hypothetical protein